ncbi:Zinc-containing alcohol dehydrogenase superfamily protein [Pseudooceanicola batsensis HTCC2597]|uniref:Zinc-containing alcohol dehydrogenase superfamily protein n=1 Tax=Pseudooceanicola batsensis (strain ATCC BAA-863 / DSM 15984 / KCTC 12145 / HTCC2597) TaxID=252305 RepID=A3TUR1_PSEBH|nr:MDR family oxidoreductase [Pseudooceanicola batsensis]EAQ04257.1 Zinc-containing alcohol dehydrogenase superfamily protein [Pseudooceanicola batsensis HTCC2597]
MSETFDAYVITRDEETKTQSGGWTTVSTDDLPEGDVTIRVRHTTMNYKDALAITGKSPVVRRFPMVPGIDIAGEVTASDSPDYKVGDEVIMNGWGVGEVHWGGYGKYARMKSDWLLKKPEGLSGAQCMALGTAGYTAALCVQRLQDAGLTPEDGTILVTGASGGVGSVAISLLAALGFTVAASTGRTEEEAYLKGLGATEIVDRNTLSEKGRPLDKELYAGAIDSVGSTTLANVLSKIKYDGTVAACGLAQGFDLPATVMPFILRGVTLAGVDSVMAPKARREAAWALLDKQLDRAKLAEITQSADIREVESLADDLIAGKVRGRLVFDID